MNRDEKKKIVQAISETFPEFITRFLGRDGLANEATQVANVLAKRNGYKRLLITVTDADTGEIITRRQTFQKPDDIPGFTDKVIELAVPSELLKDHFPYGSPDTSEGVIEPKEIPFSFSDSEGNELFEAPTGKILDKQIIGGRSKTGISEKTAKRYRALVDWYNKTDLSQAEFCEAAEISRRNLNRALKFVSENR